VLFSTPTTTLQARIESRHAHEADDLPSLAEISGTRRAHPVAESESET